MGALSDAALLDTFCDSIRKTTTPYPAIFNPTPFCPAPSYRFPQRKNKIRLIVARNWTFPCFEMRKAKRQKLRAWRAVLTGREPRGHLLKKNLFPPSAEVPGARPAARCKPASV